MRNTQKMLPDAWQPRLLWPTTIDGRHHQRQAWQFFAHAPLDLGLEAV
jgi:hypothetical protein